MTTKHTCLVCLSAQKRALVVFVDEVRLLSCALDWLFLVHHNSNRNRNSNSNNNNSNNSNSKCRYKSSYKFDALKFLLVFHLNKTGTVCLVSYSVVLLRPIVLLQAASFNSFLICACLFAFDGKPFLMFAVCGRCNSKAAV